MAAESAAPAPAAPAPVVTETVNRSRRAVSDDAILDGLGADAFLVDEAVEAATSETSRPTPKKPPRKKDPEPEPEPEDEIEAAAEEETEDAAAEEEPAPPKRGTREDPLSIKEVPDDQFVSIKVDGEKITVNLREAVEGAYMRPRAFDRLVSKANAAKAEAEQIAQAAVDAQDRMKSSFTGLLTSPENLFKVLVSRHEDVLEAVAIQYAKLRKEEEQDPSLRLRRQAEAQRAQLEAERRRVQAEREEWEARRVSEQKTAEAVKSLQPGMVSGLKRAGFPAMTPELAHETRVRLAIVKQENGEITADDVEEAIVRAARVIGPPKAKPKPAPAPIASTRPAAAGRSQPSAQTPPRTNGKRDWDAVPQNKRFNSIDWFLDT